LTRSYTPNPPPASCEELTNMALLLRERVDANPKNRFRLVGIALTNFGNPAMGWHLSTGIVELES
ncbi:MAG: hypothetical protein WA672_07540, partial [Candidatus Angelobacter sp.]